MRPATGLLFIPQVVGIISTGTNSSFVYQQSHVVAKQEDMVKEMMNFAYKIFLSYLQGLLPL
jgi:hypothetical protein